MSDPINPRHYKHLPAKAIDIILAAIEGAPSNKAAYLQGQVLKYLLRCWDKNGVEDLHKAKWYLDWLISSFDETLAEANATPIESPKRYREPTIADLANGPIDCDVRDYEVGDWYPAVLSDVRSLLNLRFSAKTRANGIQCNWQQCRIEVSE